MPVKTRTELAAIATLVAGDSRYLTESGREGDFVFDSSNLSAKVTADTNQGIYVAPASATTGASGAWVRKFTGYVDPRWFGIVTANTAAANSAAWTAMMNTLRLRATVGIYTALTGIQFQDEGPYSFNTLDFNAGTPIVTSVLLPTPTGGTVIQFTAQTGLRLQRSNTDGVSGTTGSGTGADQIIIERLHLKGGYIVPAAEAEQHGIHIRCHGVTIRNNVIENFAGDGVYVYAGTDVTQGNANCTLIHDNIITGCRDGIFFHGGDTNAGDTRGNDLSGNRRWGLNDESFLGNRHFNTIENCGLTPGTTATLVSNSGNRYALVSGGNSAIAPSGTTADTANWYYVGAGGVDIVTANIPAWSAPVLARAGGAYRTNNNNAGNIILGGYYEVGQGPAQCVWPTVVIGGEQLAGVKGVSWLNHDDTGLRVRGGVLSVDSIFNLYGSSASFGNPFGPNGDQTWQVSSNNATAIYFRSFLPGFQRDGSIHASRGSNGLQIYGLQSIQLGYGDQLAGSQVVIATVSSTGLAVTGKVTASNIGYTVVTKIAGYTETATDGELLIKADLAAGFTIVLPTAVGNKAKIHIKKIQAAGAIIVDGNAAETIDGGLTATLNNQNESITIVSDNANWMII
jgi:hypothetical protein